MSVKVMGLIWDHHMNNPTEKLVLLAYADHAGHDGDHVYPGIKTIARKVGLSERQVQRVTKKLVTDGYMIYGFGGNGRGNTNHFSINIKKIKGDIDDAEEKRVTPVTQKGDTGDIDKSAKGDIVMSPEPGILFNRFNRQGVASQKKLATRIEEEPANSPFPEEDQSQQQTEHKGDYAQPDADEILGADIIARTRRYKDNAPPFKRLGKEVDMFRANRGNENFVEWFTEGENTLLDLVCNLYSLSPPLGNRSRLADWKNGLRDIQEACGGSLEFTKQVLTEYHRQWFSDLHDPKREALTISRPGSLVEPCRAFAGRMRMASTGRDGPNGRFKTIDEFFAYIESLPQSEWHQTRLRMGFEFDPERRVYTPPWKTPVVDGVLEWFD